MREFSHLCDAIETKNFNEFVKILQNEEVRTKLKTVKVWGRSLDYSPIHKACKEGADIFMTEMLEVGININAYFMHQDIGEFTPLHLAVKHQEIGIIRMLVQNGADLYLGGKLRRYYDDGKCLFRF